jgi:branched-subunit amino acid ABC-type transport system permease component
MGIDVDRAYRIAFGLGSGITVVAGWLMTTQRAGLVRGDVRSRGVICGAGF